MGVGVHVSRTVQLYFRMSWIYRAREVAEHEVYSLCHYRRFNEFQALFRRRGSPEGERRLGNGDTTPRAWPPHCVSEFFFNGPLIVPPGVFCSFANNEDRVWRIVWYRFAWYTLISCPLICVDGVMPLDNLANMFTRALCCFVINSSLSIAFVLSFLELRFLSVVNV